MKRFFFLIILASAISISSMAEGVLTRFHRIGNGSNREVDRASMHLPITVDYDPASGIIKVTGEESIEAEVYVCDSAGQVEGYSPTLNSSFSISSPGIHYVYIYGDGWCGEAEIPGNTI